MDEPVDLIDLLTPIGTCVVVPIGAVKASVVHQLDHAGFDQAPVVDDTGSLLRVCGIVETAYLRELLHDERPLELGDTAIRNPRLARASFLHDVLQMLEVSGAALVFEVGVDEKEQSSDPIGLITVSDLNRHAFRARLYSTLATLEGELARVIEQHYADPWQWIRLLNADQQAWVLGYWELSKRRGVDVGPVAGTMLAQIITIVGRAKELLSELGYQSGSQWNKDTGRIPDMRNAVMHPVRPLILERKDVGRMRETLLIIASLTARATAIVSFK